MLYPLIYQYVNHFVTLIFAPEMDILQYRSMDFLSVLLKKTQMLRLPPTNMWCREMLRLRNLNVPPLAGVARFSCQKSS